MSQSADKRQAVLATLPPTIHLSFHQRVFARRRQAYWYAEWVEKGTGKHRSLYFGKEAPNQHPCFSGQCGHPHRRGQPKGKPSGPKASFGPKVKRTAALLQTLLQAGPRREQEVWEAVQHAGCSLRTYQRTRQMLGMETIRVGPGKNGWWELRLAT